MTAAAAAALATAVAAIGGWSPMAWAWGAAAPWLVRTRVAWTTVYAASLAVYAVHGTLLDALAAPSVALAGGGLSPAPLRLRRLLPVVAANLGSSAALLAVAPAVGEPVASAWRALALLALAVVGNELLYAPAHRLLHTRALAPIHAVHHRQRPPRALGAAYCHPLEMWGANLSSFLLPLAWARAPSGVVLVWLVAGVMATQHHHSAKLWWWTRLAGDRQPRYHAVHHADPARHFGNLGWCEGLLAPARATTLSHGASSST